MRPLRERIRRFSKIFNNPRAEATLNKTARRGIRTMAFQEAMEKFGVNDPKLRKKLFVAIKSFSVALEEFEKTKNTKNMTEAQDKFSISITEVLGKERAREFEEYAMRKSPEIFRELLQNRMGGLN